MRIGRDELRLIILQELQFGGWKLHVAFATPTKLRERAVLPAPAQRILDPWMKNTDTHSCSISTCLFGTVAGRYIYPARRSVALSVLLSSIHLHLPSTLVTQLYLGTAQHPQLHTGRSGLWPLHLRSHIATLLLGFSLSEA